MFNAVGWSGDGLPAPPDISGPSCRHLIYVTPFYWPRLWMGVGWGKYIPINHVDKVRSELVVGGGCEDVTRSHYGLVLHNTHEDTARV